MIIPTVEIAGHEDVHTLARVITEAFLHLPPSAWLVPDLTERQSLLHHYFAHLTRHALTHGVVHTTPYRDAVALWFPHGTDPEPAPRMEDLVPVVGAQRAYRFYVFEETLHAHHPVGTLHQHLAILAVAPHMQGAGIGTALLHTHHQTLDRDGIPAYLEAATHDLPELYRRHGYRPTGTPIRLPGDGTAMWPMWREPHQVT
ncbi:MAG: GNAT family N-acetyltransferase [Actinobacteria bacterium]|nr:GNAT family N-acetyltransferase [Actinomycetota bacterium]MBI3686287.1 GNAT family N-acetyltransferase [Actinomycetota bacterium]